MDEPHLPLQLLSSTFEQRGKDTEGVFGFRLKDIDHGLELIKDTVSIFGCPGVP